MSTQYIWVVDMAAYNTATENNTRQPHAHCMSQRHWLSGVFALCSRRLPAITIPADDVPVNKCPICQHLLDARTPIAPIRAVMCVIDVCRGTSRALRKFF